MKIIAGKCPKCGGTRCDKLRRCRICHAATSKRYYLSHKDERLAYQQQRHLKHKEEDSARNRKYRINHKEELAAYNREYWQTHKEERTKYNKQWYLTNGKRWYRTHSEERIKQSKKWNQAHKEATAKNSKKYRQTHKEITLIRNANRRTRELGNGGKFTLEQWNDLIAHYAPEGKCLSCGEVKPMTKDHVVSVINGGMSDINNLQPLCQFCNNSKHDKSIDYRPDGGEFAQTLMTG